MSQKTPQCELRSASTHSVYNRQPGGIVTHPGGTTSYRCARHVEDLQTAKQRTDVGSRQSAVFKRYMDLSISTGIKDEPDWLQTAMSCHLDMTLSSLKEPRDISKYLLSEAAPAQKRAVRLNWQRIVDEHQRWRDECGTWKEGDQVMCTADLA